MPGRVLATVLFLFVALAGCRTPASESMTAEVRALDPADPHRTRLGAVEVLSIHQLRSGMKWFGGISGLSFDGRTATAVNDVGHWLRFRMEVDAAGRPTVFGDLEIEPLGGLDGTGSDGDAEEIRAVDDGWMVSFERRHRLLLYRHGLSAKPGQPDQPPGYDLQPRNGGVEAMTPLADGRLLLLSEEGIDAAGNGQGWIGRPGAWETLSYRRTGLFRPTSAALLPDGDVLVLERSFSLLGGVASRLVRVPGALLRPGAVVEGRELYRLAPPLLVDNYEGMAVWKRPDGRLVAYMVADDNFSPLQATLLMSVLLPD